MSFVKTAVKKVFTFIKKVVKSKVFKWVAIAALTFFTAGVAAGGFAAFTGVTGVGSFFTAVGQTIATGAASIASTLGFKATAGKIAAHGGAAAIQAGLTTTATSATGAALTADVLTGTITAEGAAGGVLAQRGGEALALSAKGTALASSEAAALLAANPAFVTEAGLTASTIGTQLEIAANTLTQVAAKKGISDTVWKGVQVGFTAMAASKAAQKRRSRPTFVAGGLSHGKSDRSFGPNPFFVIGGPRGTNAVTQEQAAPQAPATEQATLAGQLARQESPEGVATTPQQPSGVLAAPVQGPAALPQEAQAVAQEAQGTQANTLLAQNPAQQGVKEFLGEFAPTSILAPATSGTSIVDTLRNRGALGV